MARRTFDVGIILSAQASHDCDLGCCVVNGVLSGDAVPRGVLVGAR